MTIRFNEIAEPVTPPTGKVWLYVDIADSKVKTKDDTGTVTIFEPGTDGKTLLNGVVAPTTEGVNGGIRFVTCGPRLLSFVLCCHSLFATAGHH